ncbi:hypothetical protein NE237_014553 [Protea cynaroides]|uniref:Response regulatory domain-containing protein n=1 Tax=Protea cynaroides TaxID=273540 RepID=A0A9Q0KCB6_9MAGN|nr:hypothetical protein NE237_014553 [Protea cynaroides]
MNKDISSSRPSTSRFSTSRNVMKEDIENFVRKNRLTALVVDDNCVNRAYHKALLNNLGFECQEVGNGQDAVALCRDKAFFDVILMDLEMPIMDGSEATRMLREMGVRSIVIGVTSHTEEWEIREFIEAGLDEFQQKPLTREKLISVLYELYERLFP